jgi:hypothetical protein
MTPTSLKAGIALRAARDDFRMPASAGAGLHHIARRGDGRSGLRRRGDQAGHREEWHYSRAAAVLSQRAAIPVRAGNNLEGYAPELGNAQGRTRLWTASGKRARRRANTTGSRSGLAESLYDTPFLVDKRGNLVSQPTLTWKS